VGEKFIRKHAKSFRHRQDEAYGILRDRNLLSDRPLVSAQAIRCTPTGDTTIAAGAEVILMRMQHGAIAVLYGNRHVGDVIRQDDALVDGHEHRPFTGEVLERSELTGDFTVVCHLTSAREGVESDEQ
jgi:hypothetical protein